LIQVRIQNAQRSVEASHGRGGAVPMDGLVGRTVSTWGFDAPCAGDLGHLGLGREGAAP
jgi:hypothetical protein